MIYLYSKFNIPKYSGSLVIAIKLKAKESVHTTSTSLFYILQKN
jgi:hypothetical protein